MKSEPGATLLRRLIGSLVLLYLAGTVVGGIGLGWIAVHPPSRAITATEEANAASAARDEGVDFRDAEIATSDGTALKAWFMRPKRSNGDAVILLHGVSDNRMGMYGFGLWLRRNGYTVLIPDARSHGNSGGIASYGLNEAEDIHRWMDWLQETAHPACVYGLGESMGAAQLLQSLPKEPRFCAVVAESPFATFREVAYARFGRPFHTGPWIGRTFFRPAVDAGFLYVRFRYGLNMELASPQQAVAESNVPVLLIHGLQDENIPPDHSDLIQASSPRTVAVWKVPGAVHTQAHKAAPQEFEQRVLHWFSTHGPTSTTASRPKI